MSLAGTFVGATMDVLISRVPGDVLVVEDDPIIALDLEDTIRALGAKRVRTAGSVTRALQLLEEQVPDFALLDVALVGEKSFVVAERLEALGVPFAFVTGYSAEVRLPSAFARKPRLSKPCSTAELEAMLKSAVSRRTGRGD